MSPVAPQSSGSSPKRLAYARMAASTASACFRSPGVSVCSCSRARTSSRVGSPFRTVFEGVSMVSLSWYRGAPRLTTGKRPGMFCTFHPQRPGGAMSPHLRAILAAIALTLAPSPSWAHEGHEGHEHVRPEKLGTVHFEITAAADVQKQFNRAVAFLHSFEYEEAETAFGKIADQDPTCAMALWGIAMCNYHPIWGPTTPKDFDRGKASIAAALLLKGKTAREQAYLDAVAAYYEEDPKLDFPARKAAYEEAMAALHERYPDDMEGTIFYALAILGNSPTTDKSYVKQRKAAELLNSVLPKAPDHPGVAHYLIHSLDYPGLAELALPAARVYAKIAPSAPHAQHMPSHIFTRLGY